MRISRSWLLLAASGVVAAVAVAIGLSQMMSRSDAILGATHAAPPSGVRAVSSPEVMARGARLVAVTTCTSCHGTDLTGGRLNAAGTAIMTPNLTRLATRRTDAELDRALRHGLRPTGTSELLMPSAAYASFTDEETTAVLSYLRSLPPKGVDAPKVQPGLMLRANLALGRVRTSADEISRAQPSVDLGPGLAAGRHLAAIACGRCHGTDLGGIRAVGPDLTVRGYYSRKQFHGLLSKGDAIGEGHMQLMTQTALVSFSHFNDAEIDAIYDYLDARDVRLGAQAPPKKG